MPTTKYRTLVDALYAAPSDRRFVTAWIDEDEQECVSFGEFRRRAQAQAALLQRNGVGSSDRVILIMPQGIPLMTAFAGAMLLGAVPAILAYPNFKVDPAKYRFGLAGVTANLRAKVVVIDREFRDDLVEHVAFGDDAQLVRAVGASEGEAQCGPSVAIQAGELAFIQHSAGTTGLQKGVALTHAAVLRHLEHLSSVLQIDDARDSVYSWLPLYHDMGLIACFMLPMVCHLPVIMQSPVHAGVAAQFCFSVCAATHAQGALAAVRSVLRADAHQLLGAGAHGKHERVLRRVRRLRAEALGAAGLLRDGGKRLRGDAVGRRRDERPQVSV
jgi:acyl-CoA synthetase (AMP-forming)/AMP-acid ligase II